MKTSATALVLALAVTLAGVAQAQGPGGPGTGRRPQSPDRWLTLDSLTRFLQLTPGQREDVAVPYYALNLVLKDGSAKRAQVRERMGQGGSGGSTVERQAMSARMDSMRAELQPFQNEIDQYYQAIRVVLTPEQQMKLDALPKPVVIPPTRRR